MPNHAVFFQLEEEEGGVIRPFDVEKSTFA